MKVKSRNLILGLLTFGLPIALVAEVKAETATRTGSGVVVKMEQSVGAALSEADLIMLDSVMGTQPALQEALRERLRAWTDEAEAVHRERFAAMPAPLAVLARN